MRKNKAIEILTLMGTPEFDGHTEDIQTARKLAIEALQLVRKLQWLSANPNDFKLPSETDD